MIHRLFYFVKTNYPKPYKGGISLICFPKTDGTINAGIKECAGLSEIVA
jgi:hypothetical protein